MRALPNGSIPIIGATLLFEAILFDLDGVLVDSTAAVERTWHRWAKLRDIHVPDIVARAHGRRSVETVRDVAPQLDADLEVRWLVAAELSDLGGVVALPGALATLGALRATEWAVVTSGGRELARSRLTHAALPTPTVLVAAEDVLAGKPASDGYVQAAERLGVDPSRCVVVEDTPAGVQSGRRAGAYVVALLTTFPKPALRSADTIATSLAEFAITRSSEVVTLRIGHVNSRDDG